MLCRSEFQKFQNEPEGGQGVWTPPPPPPLKNHKNIGFLSNTGPDPLKNHKATKAVFNIGQHQHASERAGWPMMARLLWYLDPSSRHQIKKKKSSNLEPLWQNFLNQRMHC